MKTRSSLLVLSLIVALVLAGCEKKSASNDKNKTPVTIARVAESEWCAEHGVPEAICTRCHANLIAAFKQKGD